MTHSAVRSVGILSGFLLLAACGGSDLGTDEVAEELTGEFIATGSSRNGDSPEEDSHEEGAQDVPVYIGREEIEIDGAGGSLFGRISGVALDPEGRLLVIDPSSSRLHVIAEDGSEVLSFGRAGEGPGEFASPCCPFVGPEGTVWVVSPGLRRVDGIDINSSPARAVDRRQIPRGNYHNMLGPVTIVSDDRLVFAGFNLIEGNLAISEVMITVDREGNVLTERRMPMAPWDSTSMIVISVGQGRSVGIWPPFSAYNIVEYSPNGSYASILTSRYDIGLYNHDGSLIRRIRRDVLGEPLTAAEREEGEASVAREAMNFRMPEGYLYPQVELPERKPPVETIWFDDEGRLWVQLYARTTTGSSQADVYSSTGELIFKSEWPSDIQLSIGGRSASRDRTAWGLRRGPFDEPLLVRLHFD